MRSCSSTLTRLCAALALGAAAAASIAHPLDPLNADEIVGAANILLQGGAAEPGAVFQTVELREPDKAAVARGAASDREAYVYWRQDKRSWKSVVNLSAKTYTMPQLIPRTQGQLGITINEVIDFAFAFQDPAFLAALAKRGITTPAQLANVFVTPLTPGSFGLP